jgi:uncharacterized protein YggU (UPF0235/DUF167 family)
MRVAVVVHPRARREALRWDGRELSLWITQPPVEGAANEAARRLVAEWLDVAPSHVRLVGGHRNAHTLFEVEGARGLPT